MKQLKPIIVGAITIAVLGAAGWFTWTTLSHRTAVANLVERAKADLIFVEGGTFNAGNYEVDIRQPDGTVERRWVIEPQSARAPETITLDSFYISADEASAQDHALFLADQDRYPPISDVTQEDGATSMTWAEARDYCAWLGELADIPLRLPTEDEWEYAARSRGAAVPFATDDGEFRWGVNVQDNDRDTPKKPLRSFPSNPLGLRDMVEGAYEWIADTAPADPAGTRIAKGSSSQSSSFYETIPARRVVNPLSDVQIELLDQRHKALAELGPVHLAQGTARCVAPEAQPPQTTGFGRQGGSFDPVPDAFGPYDQRNELLEKN